MEFPSARTFPWLPAPESSVSTDASVGCGCAFGATVGVVCGACVGTTVGSGAAVSETGVFSGSAVTTTSGVVSTCNVSADVGVSIVVTAAIFLFSVSLS